MSKGFFVVIDGTDGSGKGTQTKLLIDKLSGMGYKVKMADFPQYGKKSAGMIEEYLNGRYGSAGDVSPYQASIFYAVDRYDASFEIRKWLDAGNIVISNRYVSANMGHQAGKIDNLTQRDIYLEWLENLEYGIFNIPKPDLNIFLYLDPEISRHNALNVQKTNMDKSKDIHENDNEHMIKASEAFKYVVDKYGWETIDCGDKNTHSFRNIDDIHKDILDIIVKKFNI